MIEVLLSLAITSIILLSLTSLFQFVRYAYTPHTENQEDIYIASKQCSQYTLGSSYVEVGNIYRFINLEGEETTIFYDQGRLVKKPGYEILLFHIDDVNFYIEDDLIYMNIERDHKNYVFLLTYAFLESEEENEEDITENIQEM